MEKYAISAVVFGGILLLYEAYKEYSTADAVDNLKSNNQPSRVELENVRMTALTTKAENRRGRLIYMLMFMALYLMILVSPELIPIFFAGSDFQPEDVTGGASHVVRSIVNPDVSGGEISPLGEPSAMPFWLAMAIILGATSPTFQAVERQVRAIAYFFAGVPRNIFRVLKALEGLDYRNYGGAAHLPLYQTFTVKFARAPEDVAFRGTEQIIKSALRCIDLLQGPIIGPQRAAFRELFNDEAPLARIEDLSARYSRLRDRIRNLNAEGEGLESALSEMQEDAVDLASSMQCLFALFAIRSRKLPESLRGTPTGAIIEKVTGDETSQSLHDIALASVFGAVFSYLVVEKCAWLLRDRGLAPLAEDVRDVAANMLIPLLPSLMLMALLTIALRHFRIDQGDWTRPRHIGLPFFDYAKLALVPSLVGTLCYGVITCLQVDAVMHEFVALDFRQVVNVSGEFLKAEYVQLPRVLLMSFFTSCTLLFIADQHNNLRWYATVAAALIAAGFLWMVATFAASLFEIPAPSKAALDSGDMAILMTLPFGIFLLIYASASELAETDTVKRTFSALSAVKVPFERKKE